MVSDVRSERHQEDGRRDNSQRLAEEAESLLSKKPAPNGKGVASDRAPKALSTEDVKGGRPVVKDEKPDPAVEAAKRDVAKADEKRASDLPPNNIIPKHDYASEFQYSNGHFRYNRIPGTNTVKESVFRTTPAANGDYDEIYRGQRPEDNCSLTRRMQADRSVKFQCKDSNGVSLGEITVRADRTSQVRTAQDATGRQEIQEYDGDRKPTSRVVISTDAQGNKVEDFGNGRTTTTYRDGSRLEKVLDATGNGAGIYYDRENKETRKIQFKDGKRVLSEAEEKAAQKERELEAEKARVIAAQKAKEVAAAQAREEAERKAREEAKEKANPKLPANAFIPKHNFALDYQYANGVLHYNPFPGTNTVRESVFRTTPAANGDYDATYRGQKPEDNRSVTRRCQSDGSIKYESKDLSGRLQGNIIVRTDGTSTVHPAKDANGLSQYIDYSAKGEVTQRVVITTDVQGNTTEEFQNGARRVKYADGSKYELAMNRDNSGEDVFYDREGKEIFREKFDSNDKFAERGYEEQRLRSLIAGLPMERRDKCLADLEAFKERAEAGTVSRVEEQLTFRAATDLLAGREAKVNGQELDAEHKRRLTNLAANILQNAAFPNLIGQGNHESCPTASDEIETYWRHPALAAMAVAKIGLTGHYKDADGWDFVVDNTPHDTSKLDQVEDGDRNHASEIYQVLAMKKVMIALGAAAGRKFDYEQLDVACPADKSDTGERFFEVLADGRRADLKDSRGNDWHGLEPEADGMMGKLMFRELPTALLMGEGLPRVGPNAPKTEAISLLHSDYGAASYCERFSTEEELAAKLLDYQARGQLPVRITIQCANEPFRSQSGNWLAPGELGTHYITVTDIQVDAKGKPLSVIVDNSWSAGADGEVKFHDFYLATRDTPQNVETLKAEAAREFNPNRQMDYLNLQVTTRALTLEQVVAQSKALIDRVNAIPGGMKADEKDTFTRKMEGVVMGAPIPLALDLLQHQLKAGLLTEQEYDGCLKFLGWWNLHKQASSVHRDAGEVQERTDRLRQLEAHVNTLPEPRRKEVVAHFEHWRDQYKKLEAQHTEAVKLGE